MINDIRKYLGPVLMIAGPLIIAFTCWQAYDKIVTAAAAQKINTILQWSIILFVFIPINAGLVIFGYYAWKGYFSETSK